MLSHQLRPDNVRQFQPKSLRLFKPANVEIGFGVGEVDVVVELEVGCFEDGLRACSS